MSQWKVFRRPIRNISRTLNLKKNVMKLYHPSFTIQFRSFGGKVNPPRAQLNEWYMKEYGEGVASESSFKFEEHFQDGKIWWTARFICPKTQETYEAGTLSDEDFYDNWPWSRGEKRIPILVGNKLYYQRLKTALHAAAGRRLDVIYLENGPGRPLFCVEDPIIPLENYDSIFTATEYYSEDEYDEGLKHLWKNDQTATTEKQESTILPDMEAARRSPKVALYTYYRKMNKTLKKESFESVLHREIGTKLEPSWWSTSFVCPLSAKEYNSGSLIDEKTFGEVHYLDGRAFYTRIKSAANAAAALALDDIFFQLTGRKERKLCWEDPSLIENPCFNPDYKNRQLSQSSNLKDTIALTHREDSLEDLTIQPLDSSLLQSKTLERVMDAWSDSFSPTEGEPSFHQNSSLTDQTPTQERRRMVEGAEIWFQRLQQKDDNIERFVRFQNSMYATSLTSCNAILFALAKANEIENGADVQKIADNIFNFLWSGPKPDADTYNAYMQCLHGDSKTVAEIAHEILHDMLAGKIVNNKTKIPYPNLETFHTVMKLWAKTGDVERCQSVLKLIEENELRPDQHAYEILLSSFVNGRFNQEKVSNLIQDMQKNEFQTREAYYYPLRWGGKQYPAGYVSWDVFNISFKDGYRELPLDEDLAEAEQIENWFAVIEETPDVEVTTGCYEAVIQGWLRTGTFEGFEKAELWAHRYLDNTSERLQPRVQTFFPILSASIYLNEGPKKINKWINKLERYSASHPQLFPDGRVKAMKILAWRRFQESICEGLELDKAKMIVFESSKELEYICNNLSEYHLSGKGELHVMETATFCDVASCWGSYAKMLIKSGRKHEARNAVSRMLEVVSQYQKLIRELKGLLLHRDDNPIEETEGNSGKAPAHYLQLCHFLHRSSDIYLLVLSSLLEINHAFKLVLVAEEKETTDFFSAQYFVEIEGMLRSSNEMSRLFQTLGGAKIGYDPRYDDGYPYHEEAGKYRSTQTQLCSIIATILSHEWNDGKYLGDKIRILVLVLQVIIEEKSDEGHLLNALSDISKVFQCVRNTEKKRLFLHLLEVLSEKSSIERTELSTIFGPVKGNNLDRGSSF